MEPAYLPATSEDGVFAKAREGMSMQHDGTHTRDLFEVQRHPEGAPPHDVAGWALPLLFGVHRVAVMETVENQAAWIRASHGEGEVHLFGFIPQYRGWSQEAFELLYRAVLLTP